MEPVAPNQHGRSAYRGRFAPTPSGALHFGSAIAALASYLCARHVGGAWHVRIDDLDQPRTVAGAAASILHELERLGLHWDGPVVYQSARAAAYRDALEALVRRGRTFPCACTRREAGSGPYPGRCRAGLPPGRRGRSLRIRAEEVVTFHDRVQGPIRVDLPRTLGDFIVRRADGLPAYHLATVLDDHALGVTEVVRGADLLESTGAQILLQRDLDLPTPGYMHHPVALGARGEKLSKASGARPSSDLPAARVIAHGLRFLGQPLPPAAEQQAPATLLGWAVRRWSVAAIPSARTRPLT